MYPPANTQTVIKACRSLCTTESIILKLLEYLSNLKALKALFNLNSLNNLKLEFKTTSEGNIDNKSTIP